VDLVAHVLPCETVEDLGQGLIDRVEGDVSGQARVDVEVDPGVAGQCEEQILDIHPVTTTE
jgi:hypothetical protein